MTAINDIVKRATDFRHDLHRHPEIAFQEERTAAIIRQELDRLGIEWQAVAGTGTIADLASDRDGELIALRADIDALPMDEETGLDYASTIENRMHACGHDGHTASLLGTAAWLKQHEDQLQQPVRLLFQPGEEGAGGARKMISGGALDGVAMIFGYHNWPQLALGSTCCVPGPFMAANGYYKATITGRGGHASQPDNCLNPVSIAADCVPALHQLTSQKLAPQDVGVVTVSTFHAGSADNIIPAKAIIGGTIRAMTTEIREHLARWSEEAVKGVTARYGGEVEWNYQPTYPATVNDPEATTRARKALEQVPGIDHFVESGLPIMASEDFSFYLQEIPGCFIFLGGAEEDRPIEVCHSPRFDYNDRILPRAIGWFSALVGAPIPE